MKAFAALILMSLTVCALIVVAPTRAYGAPSVGVKKGDWLEYNVDITGTPPPIHNVTWMRIEVLQVEGAAFPVNLTVRYANGTFFSSIWKFNFTAGNTEGWIIIPAMLGPEDTFYDASSKTNQTIAIQSQTQKTVLGATRTVTYGNDSLRHKEWDKDTGIFISSSEALKNWTAQVNLVATNLWSPQILGLNPTLFYTLVAASIVTAAFVASSVIVVKRRKRIKVLTLHDHMQGTAIFEE